MFKQETYVKYKEKFCYIKKIKNKSYLKLIVASNEIYQHSKNFYVT